MSSPREWIWTRHKRESRADFCGIWNWKFKKRKRIKKGRLRRKSQKWRRKVRRMYFPSSQVLRNCHQEEKVIGWNKCSWEFKLTEDSELLLLLYLSMRWSLVTLLRMELVQETTAKTFNFILECSQLTMLCQFQAHSKATNSKLLTCKANNFTSVSAYTIALQFSS